MVRPADEDFHDERTTYMQTNDLEIQTLARQPGLRVYVHPTLAEEAAYMRQIVDDNTYDWWAKAHRQAEPEKEVRDYKNFSREIDYHTRFRGYCPRCQKGG
jgi:hypothetical protein